MMGRLHRTEVAFLLLSLWPWCVTKTWYYRWQVWTLGPIHEVAYFGFLQDRSICQRWVMFHSSMPLIWFGSPTPNPGFKNLEIKTWLRQTFESFIAVFLIQFSLCWLTWKNYFLIPFCEQTCEQFEKPIKRIKFWWRGKNAFLPIERIFVRWQSNLETETVVVAGEFNFF